MSEKSPDTKLLEKIFKARKEAEAVAKKGHGTNGDEDFHFSRFEDVLVEAKRLLEKHRIVYVSSVIEETLHFGQKGCLAKVVIEYTVTDLTGGGSLKVRWSGSGFDTPGGTALFMAETGTEKYFLARLLQIPWGEDPETQDEAPELGATDETLPDEPLDPKRAAHLIEGIEIAKPALAETGVNWFDGLNVLLGSLGIDGFDPTRDLDEEIARVSSEQADRIDLALQAIADEGAAKDEWHEQAKSEVAA